MLTMSENINCGLIFFQRIPLLENMLEIELWNTKVCCIHHHQKPTQKFVRKYPTSRDDVINYEYVYGSKSLFYVEKKTKQFFKDNIMWINA